MDKNQGFVLTSVFNMESEKGKEIGEAFIPFCHQFQQFLDLPEKSKEEYVIACIATMKKLGKVANAVDRYSEIEKKESEKLLKRAKEDKSSIPLAHGAESVEIEGAIEEVLTQTKASLDIVIKILNPMWNINLPTYGKAGETVANSLKRNIPKNNSGRVANLIKLVEQSIGWIKLVRDYRTQGIHQNNIAIIPMHTINTEHEQRIVLPKMRNGQPVNEFLEIVYNNLFCFLQDFIALTIDSKVYGGMAIGIINGEKGKKRKFGVYIKPESIREG